jgi:hypothetical protein
MRKIISTLIVIGALASWTSPGLAVDNPQQQRMTECNAKATGMAGDARKTFMSSCLSNKPSAGPSELQSSKEQAVRQFLYQLG